MEGSLPSHPLSPGVSKMQRPIPPSHYPPPVNLVIQLNVHFPILPHQHPPAILLDVQVSGGNYFHQLGIFCLTTIKLCGILHENGGNNICVNFHH